MCIHVSFAEDVWIHVNGTVIIACVQSVGNAYTYEQVGY